MKSGMERQKRNWRLIIAIAVIHGTTHLVMIVVVLLKLDPHGHGAESDLSFSLAVFFSVILSIPIGWTGLLGGPLGVVLLIPVNSGICGFAFEVLLRRITRR